MAFSAIMKVEGFRTMFRTTSCAAPRGLQASSPRTRCRQEAGGTCADGSSSSSRRRGAVARWRGAVARSPPHHTKRRCLCAEQNGAPGPGRLRAPRRGQEAGQGGCGRRRCQNAAQPPARSGRGPPRPSADVSGETSPGRAQHRRFAPRCRGPRRTSRGTWARAAPSLSTAIHRDSPSIGIAY